mmetsp:Transcript_13469/g.28577  ORF Transcript_13469/g.28577 Transcript_13469/m.28577 type:complete len:203 (+) Transcript_13469:244-852(+)
MVLPSSRGCSSLILVDSPSGGSSFPRPLSPPSLPPPSPSLNFNVDNSDSNSSTRSGSNCFFGLPPPPPFFFDSCCCCCCCLLAAAASACDTFCAISSGGSTGGSPVVQIRMNIPSASAAPILSPRFRQSMAIFNASSAWRTTLSATSGGRLDTKLVSSSCNPNTRLSSPGSEALNSSILFSRPRIDDFFGIPLFLTSRVWRL